MLPPESAAAEDVAREIGIGADTHKRWCGEALAKPARERAWTAVARFDAALTAAAMDEAAKNAWCRASGAPSRGPSPSATLEGSAGNSSLSPCRRL